MRSHFDRDPAALPRAERLRQAFAGGGDFSFSDHVAGAVQDAITTRLVAQVHADRDRLVARGSRWPRTLSGNDILLHGRSPLHFECVPIGSLSHPVGGRPSHPISVEPCSFATSDAQLLLLLLMLDVDLFDLGGRLP